VGDAIVLTRHAAELGLAGALLLPPFYYKCVDNDGVVAYFERIVTATKDRPVPLYLYHFPAMSGVHYSPALIRRLRSEFPGRIVGLKDSSGDLDYAKEAAGISPDFRVFPSNEATLLRSRAGQFAGCISASANFNPEFCGRAFNEGDQDALQTATTIRALVSRKAIIASVKAAIAYRLNDPAFEALLPPLTRLSEEDKRGLIDDIAPLFAAKRYISEAAAS
jgi:4-hydroxy-tetrahydrodipicolinate synthase